MSEQPEEEVGKSEPYVPPATGIPPELKQTIRRIAEEPGASVEPQKLEKAVLAVIRRSSFSFRQGPLPHPQELAEYEKILPGSAERILSSSEKQLNHRLRIEQQTVTCQNIQSGRGQIFGFVIALVGFLCAFGAIETGYPIAGTFIGSFDLIALVSVFVYGKHAQKVDLREKAKAVPHPRDN